MANVEKVEGVDAGHLEEVSALLSHLRRPLVAMGLGRQIVLRPFAVRETVVRLHCVIVGRQRWWSERIPSFCGMSNDGQMVLLLLQVLSSLDLLNCAVHIYQSALCPLPVVSSLGSFTVYNI